MEDDGLPKRLPPILILAAAIAIAILISLVPGNVVSYKADPIPTETNTVIDVPLLSSSLVAQNEPISADPVTDGLIVVKDTKTVDSSLSEPEANQFYVSPHQSDETRNYQEIPVYDAATEEILYAIGMCESGGRQFRDDGSVVKNPHSSATGKYQLMSSIWRPVAESMAINIDTEAGNKQMAYYILKEVQGIQAWEASAACLSNYGITI